MEQVVAVLVVGIFVAVWVALAVACVRNGRRRWVVWAVAVPVVVLALAVAAVGLAILTIQSGQLSAEEELARVLVPFVLSAIGIGLAIAWSYIMLIVGVIARPRVAEETSQDSTKPGVWRYYNTGGDT